ncbi:MAG: glycosyltransferase 87 family protein [Bacilli bacterium]|nr:glycosyltransferase 87 family protein [Bacilli bacterium]
MKNIQSFYKSILAKIKNKINLPLSKTDWIVLGIIAGFCFITFQQGDIYHTVGSSFAYLKGHIFDFYEYNKEFVLVNNYLPSSYLFFAIWNIPLKIMGLINLPTLSLSLIIIWWNKILTTIFYVLAGIVVYKIGKVIGFSEKKSKLTAFIWLTTPIALFSQFIFGQYDIFTLFFTLLGLLFYFKKDTTKFILFFGIAMTFKYFPIFIFIPLLLAKEKNIWEIVKKCFYVMIPIAIEILIYIWSPAFRDGVLGFSATGYIFGTQIVGTGMSIKLFVFFWLVLCACSYFKEIKDNDSFIKYVFFYCGLVCFLIFGMSLWHPQWVLFMTPFLVFGTVINKKTDIYLFLDILLMFFFIAFTVNFWTNHLDQQLFIRGIFKYMATGIESTTFMMNSLFRISDKDIFYTAFSAILFIKVIFSHPKFCMENIKTEINKHIPIIRARLIIGILIFIIPAFICLGVYLYNK